VTGLRERKKQASRRKIIDAAVGLFAEQGIDATTMDEVAGRADFSVATVYNYFGSKTALLLAAVDEDTTRMVDRGATVLAEPGSDASAAVKALLGVYLEEFTAWDPALLREVMSASFRRVGGAEVTAELARMDERLLAQMIELLTRFQADERLRNDVDPSEAALLVFSTMVTHLFMYLAFDDVDSSLVVEQINRQVDLAFAGLAPPNNEKATPN
jgi:AcrR family transcriptional regulator